HATLDFSSHHALTPAHRHSSPPRDQSTYFFFSSINRPPPRSTLFPYTTLFRSEPNPRRTGCQEIRLPASPAAARAASGSRRCRRSEEHTSELQSLTNLVCRLLLEKKKRRHGTTPHY